jgi:hypothetical protein
MAVAAIKTSAFIKRVRIVQISCAGDATDNGVPFL